MGIPSSRMTTANDKQQRSERIRTAALYQYERPATLGARLTVLSSLALAMLAATRSPTALSTKNETRGRMERKRESARKSERRREHRGKCGGRARQPRKHHLTGCLWQVFPAFACAAAVTEEQRALPPAAAVPGLGADPLRPPAPRAAPLPAAPSPFCPRPAPGGVILHPWHAP